MDPKCPNCELLAEDLMDANRRLKEAKALGNQATDLMVKGEAIRERMKLESIVGMTSSSPASRRCPCEFPEVESCRPECSCRSSVMSGGCDRCATYGSYEQQVEAAKSIAMKLDEAYRRDREWGP